MSVLDQLFSLEGKTALVTGGAQGIGKSVALNLCGAGADVVLLDLNKDKAQQTARDINQQTGKRAIAIQADVTSPQAVATAIEDAAAQMGGLDFLFNNAGIGPHKSSLDVTPEEWLKVIDVNLNGVFFVAQAFARYLVKNGRPGSICNTASMSGHIVNIPQEQAAYNASKAAVIHLTKTLAVEFCPHNIRVNCISPGYIATELIGSVRQDYQEKWTDLTPAKRFGKPEELAGAVIYLFSDSSSFTSGSDIIIDGCYSAV